jgi:hypothetical protein
MSIRRTLTNTPDVISIGFVWDSDQPSSRHINRVVGSIGTVLHPADVSLNIASEKIHEFLRRLVCPAFQCTTEHALHTI